MPCHDPRDNIRTETVYESGISPFELSSIKDRVSQLEAGLCAIFNELERRGIADDVIAKASRSGLIGIMDFWERHSKQDEARVARILHNYSEDEQAMMLKLLKKKVD